MNSGSNNPSVLRLFRHIGLHLFGPLLQPLAVLLRLPARNQQFSHFGKRLVREPVGQIVGFQRPVVSSRAERFTV